ncbi:MAG TPA: TadE/TadG family type IV pilus assembly protein [Pararhizobium sp.]|nr:TadE/TadG family type IV pilus assembly protein [Pararhizobium sp.]
MGHVNRDGAGRRPGRLRRLLHSRDGVAAIEFAILAIPFFLIVFAIIETFVAYAGEQLLENAVDTMSRKIRTGQITAANTSEEQFRTAFCDEISIMMSCSGTGDEQKLYLDVETYKTFADMPTGVPRVGGGAFGELDDSSFGYDPGPAGSKNMVRAYYKWPIRTDLVRPYISNVRPTGGTSYFLMVATTAFANENYP